jgi:phospholipid-transporting ATPase
MKRTGIKVWVLTGDKVGTAINIGLSAGLLETTMTQHKILAETHEGVQEEIKKTSQLLLENESASSKLK